MFKKNSMMSVSSKLMIIGVAFATLVLVSVISVKLGTIQYSVAEILDCVLNRSESSSASQIINNVRIPRILNGIFVGMNLSVAGVILQGILRNPMASPNIIGVNAGASFAAVLIMAVLPGFMQLIPVAAFLGALLASLLIYAISLSSKTSGATVHIVLAGVAITALLNALTSGMMTIFNDILDVAYSWTLGTLSGRSWQSLFTLLPYSLTGISLAIFLSPKLNLFALGDELATSVGMNITKYRLILITIASVLAGSAVSAAGAIGFIGLVSPHISRLIIGADNRFLIPLSAIFGAILLVVSDTVARVAFQPIELSVGVVTAVIGSPFFLALLFKTRHQN